MALVDQESWYQPTGSPGASTLCGFLGSEQQEARGLFHKHKGCTVSPIHPHWDLKSSRKQKPALFQRAHLLMLLQENGVQDDHQVPGVG